ncbi:MAG: hypothetical protein K9M07_03195 [Simkaniaceae bacterium]|nr:hypothetical protein [Simkaniaceae bacterium]
MASSVGISYYIESMGWLSAGIASYNAYDSGRALLEKIHSTGAWNPRKYSEVALYGIDAFGNAIAAYSSASYAYCEHQIRTFKSGFSKADSAEELKQTIKDTLEEQEEHARVAIIGGTIAAGAKLFDKIAIRDTSVLHAISSPGFLIRVGLTLSALECRLSVLRELQRRTAGDIGLSVIANLGALASANSGASRLNRLDVISDHSRDTVRLNQSNGESRLFPLEYEMIPEEHEYNPIFQESIGVITLCSIRFPVFIRGEKDLERRYELTTLVVWILSRETNPFTREFVGLDDVVVDIEQLCRIESEMGCLGII